MSVNVFYRWASAAEVKDVLETRQLRQGPNSMEGKNLTNTEECARKWGERLVALWGAAADGQVLRITVPDSSRFDFLRRVDNICDAWFARLPDLVDAQVEVLP